MDGESRSNATSNHETDLKHPRDAAFGFSARSVPKRNASDGQPDDGAHSTTPAPMLQFTV